MFFLSSRGEEHHITALGFTANRKEPGLGSVSAAGSLVEAVGSLAVRAASSPGKSWMVPGIREQEPSKLEPGSRC